MHLKKLKKYIFTTKSTTFYGFLTQYLYVVFIKKKIKNMEQLTLKKQLISSWVKIFVHVVVFICLCVVWGSDIENTMLKYLTTLFIVVIYVVVIFLLSMKLNITLSDNNIRYKLSPFQLKYTQIEKAEISKILVRKVNAIAEFGGYGIRYNNGYKAYILDGNSGLDIQYLNKKLLLSIDINDTERVIDFLKKHNYLQ